MVNIELRFQCLKDQRDALMDLTDEDLYLMAELLKQVHDEGPGMVRVGALHIRGLGDEKKAQLLDRMFRLGIVFDPYYTSKMQGKYLIEM